MIQIRQAREEDIAAIEAIYHRRVAFNNAHDIPQWRYDQVTWNEFSKLYTIAEYYVIEVDQVIAGGCFIVDVDELYWPEESAGNALYLHKIVIDPAYSGQRLADHLITFFKEKGKREGYPCVRIDVRAHKEKLRSMYERNGFQLVKLEQFVPEYRTALYSYPCKGNL